MKLLLSIFVIPAAIFAQTFQLGFSNRINLDKYLFIEVSKYIPIFKTAFGEFLNYRFTNNYIVPFADHFIFNSLVAVDLGIAIDFSQVIDKIMT